MAPEHKVVIKNIEVSPDQTTNDGGGSFTVSAVVFSPRDRARVTGVTILPEFAETQFDPLPFSMHPGKSIEETGEGVCRVTAAVPLLSEPGKYQLEIRATDSEGGKGAASAGLEVFYRRPEYNGPLTGPAFHSALDLTGPPAIDGNRVEVLTDGGEAFQRRLGLIRSARTQINLESYTLKNEGRCAELLQSLVEKAAAGVEVNIILNESSQLAVSPITAIQLGLQSMGRNIQEWVENTEAGEGLREMVRELIEERLGLSKGRVNLILADDRAILGEDENGDLRAPRARKWLDKLREQNRPPQKKPKKNRERSLTEKPVFSGPGGLPSLPGLSWAVHEKILVVDGERAIIGGRNLEDQYFSHWTDTDLYLEGPVVREVQQSFLETFREFSKNLGRDPEITALLPSPAPAGDIPLRFIPSRPWRGDRRTLNALVTAIQAAQKRILITSQFVVLPDCLLRDALLDAASRGVEISILTNSLVTIQETGVAGGYFLTLGYIGPLLEAGIRFFEVKPEKEPGPQPYLHAKEFLFDSSFALIGSMNLSLRSSYIESENLVAIPSPALVKAQEKMLLHRIEHHAEEITPSAHEALLKKFKSKISMSKFLELLY